MNSELPLMPSFGDQPNLRLSLCELCNDHRLLFFNDFDDCIVGVVSEYGRVPRVAYDAALMMDVLMARRQVPEEHVERVFEEQIASKNMGPYAPIMIVRPPDHVVPNHSRFMPS